MDVLISIKPKYVNRILRKEKAYEFRKKIFKQTPKRIFIYSTSPVKLIIGHFNYSGYLVDMPCNIWNQTDTLAGISKQSYDEYFKGRKIAYAIKIEFITVFNPPLNPYELLENFHPPQSFMYLKDEIFR